MVEKVGKCAYSLTWRDKYSSCVWRCGFSSIWEDCVLEGTPLGRGELDL